jgi:hypothetical protein
LPAAAGFAARTRQESRCLPKAELREDDGEKEWLQEHTGRLASMGIKPIFLGDDIYAAQPLVELVDSLDARYIFVAKDDSHKTLVEYVSKRTPEELTVTMKADMPGVTRHRTITWMNDVPINAGKSKGMNKEDDDYAGAARVNYVKATDRLKTRDGLPVRDKNGAEVVSVRSFVTNIEITAKNANKIIDCGAGRWEIENRFFNNLKNQGYNLGHRYAHGKLTMQTLCSTMTILSFAMQTAAKLLIKRFRSILNRYGGCRLDIQWRVLITADGIDRYIELCLSYFPGWLEVMEARLAEARRQRDSLRQAEESLPG